MLTYLQHVTDVHVIDFTVWLSMRRNLRSDLAISLTLESNYMSSGSLVSKALDRLRMQNSNFSSSFVWVWDLTSHIKGRTWTEGVWEQGAEEDIWS
jgi:hypothetical protein